MPNWVRNKVYFKSEKVMQDCYNIDEEENETFDFNKVIPMPKSMHLTSGGNEKMSICYAYSKMSDEEKENLAKRLKETDNDYYGNYFNKLLDSCNYTDEDYKKEDKELKKYISGKKVNEWDNVDYKGLGIKNLQDLGNTYINNILEYGCDTWYDWSCKHWGTKWNCNSVYAIDDNNVEFETAWSCPYELLKEISKKYNTKVVVEYADEDIGSNCGTLTFENGEETDYEKGDSNFAYHIWGYTDEDIKEFEEE